MNLKYNKTTTHYKPVLISIWGEETDPYCETRAKWFEQCIHTPIGVAMFGGDGLHIALNESIQYCMDNKIDFMILVHQSIAPRADWSEVFRGMSMKRHAFIYRDNMVTFIVINVKKVRKYDYYRTIGSAKDLHKWLVAKAQSEGHNVRMLNEVELKCMGAANEELEPTTRKTKFGLNREEYSRNKKRKKTSDPKKKRKRATKDE